MDTQAKERLTGAVILVALLVLLVPELLSGPGPQIVQVAASPTEEPPLRSFGPGHVAACHYPLQSAELELTAATA